MRIASIVEGHGDQAAVPELLRRIARELRPGLEVDVPRPIRIPRTRLLNQGELERAVELAVRSTTPEDGILVLLDSDDDCPATLGPALLSRGRGARADRRLAVVLAKREYEAWFLAAAASLRGVRGLASDLQPPADPEGIRDAKGWLTANNTAGGIYRETVDQVALTSVFDLKQARMASSFDKLWRDLERLLTVPV